MSGIAPGQGNGGPLERPAAGPGRPRVLYVLRDYPQLSQTYIKSEIEAMQETFDLRVVALNPPDIPFRSPVPFVHETEPAGTEFNLYAFGYHIERLHDLARAMDSPARIMPPVQPDDMPAEYKRHRWLVYTACPERASVGWPMAVAEAQAAGVGVCMANVRPDLREYVGDAGFLYDSLADARRIVSGPFPAEMQERGFALARRCDVSHHRAQLTALWRPATAVRRATT